VQHVVQFDPSRVTIRFIRGIKVRMSILKTSDARCEVSLPAARLQIQMALRARLIACRRKIDLSAMVNMTFGAFGRASLLSMMNWSIMTSEAPRILRPRRKTPRGLNVARRALRFEHRVWICEPAARINPRITR